MLYATNLSISDLKGCSHYQEYAVAIMEAAAFLSE